MIQPHKILFEQGILKPEQFEYLEKIQTKQLFSVHFELRTLLYIGVLLLTTGIGFIIYLNMGQVAHIALISTMILLEGAVIWYIRKHQIGYTNSEQNPPTPYFDYLLLFGALLVISIFTYILIQYELLESFLEWSSLISAIIFFYLAFRYDHRGVLSLAITAFAAFWGLSVSPIDWTRGEATEIFRLYNSGIFVGLLLTLISEVLTKKNIKKHFSFTFKNFGLILFYVGITNAISDSDYWEYYAFGSLLVSLYVSIAEWKNQEYLFFVYAAIGGYIAFTRVFFELAKNMPFELWMIYSMASMGGLIWMIERIITNKRKNRQL